MNWKSSILLLFLSLGYLGQSQEKHFDYMDVFDLQFISDPQISPDGGWIVYRRMGFDILNDRAEGD